MLVNALGWFSVRAGLTHPKCDPDGFISIAIFLCLFCIFYLCFIYLFYPCIYFIYLFIDVLLEMFWCCILTSVYYSHGFGFFSYQSLVSGNGVLSVFCF